MTIRRRNLRRTDSLADVIDALPDSLLQIEFQADNTMSGLRDYIRELRAHLSHELGYQADSDVVTQVLDELGIPVSEWYRQAFQQTG